MTKTRGVDCWEPTTPPKLVPLTTRMTSALRFGPTICYSDIQGEFEEVKSFILDSLPLKNVEVKTSALLTIPELPLRFEPVGYLGDIVLHMIICRCYGLDQYRSTVKALITNWWRERLESSHEWFIVIIDESAIDPDGSQGELMKKVGEDFHSRSSGDRSCSLADIKAKKWNSVLQPHIEKSLSSRSMQYDDEITSIVDAEFVLNKVFCLHDSFACLAESLGLWKEALLQYNECLKTIEQNQKLSTQLPIHSSVGFTDRSPFDMRQMAKDSKELNFGEVIHYIFLRKAQLLFVLNRPSEVLQTGFQMVLLTLEQHGHSIDAKRWAVHACWEIMQQFRLKFGHIELKQSASSPSPTSTDNLSSVPEAPQLLASPRNSALNELPKLDKAERSVIALHVTNLLCCLHRCYLDVAAQTPNLRLSYIWSIRKMDQTSQLIWKRSSPLMKKELPKRPRRPPPMVPGSRPSPLSTPATVESNVETCTTFSEPSVAQLLTKEFELSRGEHRQPDPFFDVNLSEDTDWLSKALSDVVCFEKCYLKVLQLLCGYYNISRRKRIALVFARELIELAWHREDFSRLVDMLSAGEAPSAHWQALQLQSHYAALCYRQMGELKHYLREVLSLIDQEDGSYGGGAGNLLMESFRIYDHYSFLIQDVERINLSFPKDGNNDISFDYNMTKAFRVKNIRVYHDSEAKEGIEKSQQELVISKPNAPPWKKLQVFSDYSGISSSPMLRESSNIRCEKGEKVKGLVNISKHFKGCASIKPSGMQVRFVRCIDAENPKEEKPSSLTTESLNDGDWQFFGEDDIIIPFTLLCSEAGSFSLEDVTLFWGVSRLHLLKEGCNHMTIEVNDRPTKPGLELICPQLVSYRTTTTISVIVTNYEYEEFKGCLLLERSSGYMIGEKAEWKPLKAHEETRVAKECSLPITPKEGMLYSLSFTIQSRQTIEIVLPIAVDMFDENLLPTSIQLKLSASVNFGGFISDKSVCFPCTDLICFHSNVKELSQTATSEKKSTEDISQWMVGWKMQKISVAALNDVTKNMCVAGSPDLGEDILEVQESSTVSHDGVVPIDPLSEPHRLSLSPIHIELEEYEVTLEKGMSLVEDPNCFDDNILDQTLALCFLIEGRAVDDGKISLSIEFETIVGASSTDSSLAVHRQVRCHCTKTVYATLGTTKPTTREMVSVAHGQPLLLTYTVTQTKQDMQQDIPEGAARLVKFCLCDLDMRQWMCATCTVGSTRLSQNMNHELHGQVSFLLIPLVLGELKIPTLEVAPYLNESSNLTFEIHSNVQSEYVMVVPPTKTVGVVTNIEC